MAKNNNLNLDFILQSIKDYAIFMLDKNGKIKTWNRAAEKIYLYKKRDVIGKSPSIFFTQSDVENNHPEKSLKMAAEKGRHEDEGLRIKKDKSLFWASVIVAPVYNKQKKLEGFVKVVRDITERKRKEDEKDEFLGTVSHELKTPVTSIKAYIQSLEKKFIQKGDSYSAELTAKMDRQINKMTSLINDLLDSAKMRSGKLKFNENHYNVLNLVSETLDEIQPTTEKQLIKKLGKPGIAFGDRNRIAQVITNFISNAIKFSPNSSKIIISSAVKGAKIEICVRDFGLGISKEKQEYIFKRFYRANGQDRETFPGLGLGLYISNEIIIRQGGKIRFESKEGVGSTFCFSLPVETDNDRQIKIKW